MNTNKAIFAAGCFWGVQAIFDNVNGVVSTTVGYTGGTLANPTYEQVCTGTTNHAEAVLIEFDESIISYDELLDIYFKSHNPTTLNQQNYDIGTQYRSAIFTLNEQQEQAAINKIRELNAKKIYSSPIVTQVLPEAIFYPAEEYHQKYFKKHNLSSCHIMPNIPDEKEESKKQKISVKNRLFFKERKKEIDDLFNGSILYTNDDGIFFCGACGNPIFITQNNIDSNPSCPNFDKAIPLSITLTDDLNNNFYHTEVICAVCGSHLGHIPQKHSNTPISLHQ